MGQAFGFRIFRIYTLLRHKGAGTEALDVQAQVFRAVPAVDLHIVNDIHRIGNLADRITQFKGYGIERGAVLFEFQSEMLRIGAHGAAALHLHPPANEGGQRIGFAKRSQPLQVLISFISQFG